MLLQPQVFYIERGLSDAERASAAALYWCAFGKNLSRVMGPDDRALGFITRVMRPDHAYCARDASGQLIGIIGYRSQAGSFVGGDHIDLLASYGRFGAFWRRMALNVLAQDLAKGDVAIDGIVVASHCQSQGVGAALLAHLAKAARQAGYQRLVLDVVRENTRARALYERQGYVFEKVKSRLVTAWLYRYRHADRMVLELNQKCQTHAPKA